MCHFGDVVKPSPDLQELGQMYFSFMPRGATVGGQLLPARLNFVCKLYKSVCQ